MLVFSAVSLVTIFASILPEGELLPQGRGEVSQNTNNNKDSSISGARKRPSQKQGFSDYDSYYGQKDAQDSSSANDQSAGSLEQLGGSNWSEIPSGQSNSNQPSDENSGLESNEANKNWVFPTSRPSGNVPARPTSAPAKPCVCFQTPQYNPVCGTNNKTYNNERALECENLCKTATGLKVAYIGACVDRPRT